MMSGNPEINHLEPGHDASRPGASDRVSVIVPCFRHERFISACLDSVVASDYPDIEIIIINDASPERDAEVIRRWLARPSPVPARYVEHDVNRGLPATLNEGIGLATGSYICIVAGDDLLLPEGIRKRVEYLEQNPSMLAVFADCHVIDAAGHAIVTSGIEDMRPGVGLLKRDLRIPYLMPYLMLFRWAVPGPVFLARRELYSLLGGYDEELEVEDWDMYLRTALAGRLGFLDEHVAAYRRVPQGMTARNRASGFFARSFEKTVTKYEPYTSGLIRSRLIALRFTFAYLTTKPGPQRYALLAAHRAMLALTNTAFRILLIAVRVANRLGAQS